MVAQVDSLYVEHARGRGTLRRLLTYGLFEGRPATTRGRWVNPIVLANYDRVLRNPAPKQPDRPVFIIGVGRSGTTHLGRIFSIHPEVGWLNEPKAMWSRIVPNEDVSGFYSDTGRFRLSESDVTPEVRRRAYAAATAYLGSVKATRLVDKYPELTYRIPFLRALYPDAKIVAIVRRPDDFAESIVDWNQRNASHSEDWWGVSGAKWSRIVHELAAWESDLDFVAHDEGLSVRERAGVEWAVAAREIRRHRTTIDSVIHYEDLLADPVSVTRAVLEACQLEVEARVLRFAAYATSSKQRQCSTDFGKVQSIIDRDRREFGY